LDSNRCTAGHPVILSLFFCIPFPVGLSGDFAGVGMDAKRAENRPKKGTAKRRNHHQKKSMFTGEIEFKTGEKKKRAKIRQQKQLNPTKNGRKLDFELTGNNGF
jgi:hypothetical protein